MLCWIELGLAWPGGVGLGWVWLGRTDLGCDSTGGRAGLCGVVLCSVALHNVVLCCVVSCCVGLCCVVFRWVVLGCVGLCWVRLGWLGWIGLGRVTLSWGELGWVELGGWLGWAGQDLLEGRQHGWKGGGRVGELLIATSDSESRGGEALSAQALHITSPNPGCGSQAASREDSVFYTNKNTQVMCPPTHECSSEGASNRAGDYCGGILMMPVE